ncbi:MAG: HAD family hydrolase [Candidatus Aureabacteria bacterium]|nr:HAD family hydrolase [Candidatus Auribacterota bacterium]
MTGVAPAENSSARGGDPLPSWNDRQIKQRILRYVEQTADPLRPSFIPPEDRIATFDNDGTLWCEKPDYPPLALSLQYFGLMNPPHAGTGPIRLRPEELERGMWRIVDGVETFFRTTIRIFNAIGIGIDLRHGMTYSEYQAEVEKYLSTSYQPRFHRPYTETVYQPMLELMQYLRDNGSRVYIVTAGGSDFVRVFSHKIYNVETANVVGGTTDFKFKMLNGSPSIVLKFRPLKMLRGGGKTSPSISTVISGRGLYSQWGIPTAT